MTEDFDELDKLYRVSEKKEIEKFNRIGRTTREFYDQKAMEQDLSEQKSTESDNGSAKVSSVSTERMK